MEIFGQVEFKGHSKFIRIINRLSEKENSLNKRQIFSLITLSIIFASFSIPYSFAEEKLSVEIISVEPIRANQWTISWDACSLVDKVGQDFKITTDLEWESFHFDFILYKDQCMADMLGHPVISILDAKDPDSITISLDEPTPITNEQKIVITDVMSTKIQGKYVAFFDVCAAEKRLIGPEILVYSDIDKRQAPVGSVIGINSCFGHSAEIYADSIDSIKADFAESIEKASDDKSLVEVADMQTQLEDQNQEIVILNQEISDLKETLAEKDEIIQKKDAVLMEQIKVITDLAKQVTNTIFESLSKMIQF